MNGSKKYKKKNLKNLNTFKHDDFIWLKNGWDFDGFDDLPYIALQTYFLVLLEEK